MSKSGTRFHDTSSGISTKAFPVAIESRPVYIVLLKNIETVLPKSFGMARKRLLAIERKMNFSPESKTIYKEQMDGFLSKGNDRKLSENKLTINEDRIWYVGRISSLLTDQGKGLVTFPYKRFI